MFPLMGITLHRVVSRASIGSFVCFSHSVRGEQCGQSSLVFMVSTVTMCCTQSKPPQSLDTNNWIVCVCVCTLILFSKADTKSSSGKKQMFGSIYKIFIYLFFSVFDRGLFVVCKLDGIFLFPNKNCVGRQWRWFISWLNIKESIAFQIAHIITLIYDYLFWGTNTKWLHS